MAKEIRLPKFYDAASGTYKEYYPATTSDAVVDPTLRKSQTEVNAQVAVNTQKLSELEGETKKLKNNSEETVLKDNSVADVWVDNDGYIICKIGELANGKKGLQVVGLYDKSGNDILEQINKKQDKIVIDIAPTEGSSNTVSSDGVFKALSSYLKKENDEEVLLSDNGNSEIWCDAHGNIGMKLDENGVLRVKKIIADGGGEGGSAVTPEIGIYEPIINQAGRESILYLNDIIKDKGFYKASMTGCGYASADNEAWLPSPTEGTKTGNIQLNDGNNAFSKSVQVITTKKPSKTTINILDIGSSYIDSRVISQQTKDNIEEDGISVSQLGTMGVDGARHEARAGGTWDFITKPNARAVILTVSGVTELPTTAYPGTAYLDPNGVKWVVRGVMINGGSGKLVLSSFSVDPNYGGSSSGNGTDYDQAAINMPSSGTITKTTPFESGTTKGDATIAYSAKELAYYNPFWNPASNALDFRYYVNKWGFNTPDVVTLTFGSNDLGNTSFRSETDVNAVVAKAKTVIDKLHTDYPNCKVVITCSTFGYGGKSAFEHQNGWREHNLRLYYKKMVDTFGQSSGYANFVAVCPTCYMVDRIKGFTNKSVQPCKRYDETISCVTSSTYWVHPNTNGYKQFADAVVPYIYYLFNK